MAKTGPKPRPISELKKNKVAVFFTDDELDVIDEKRKHLKRAEYIRKCALNKKLPKSIPELNQSAWIDLARLAANFNQFIKILNQSGIDFGVVEDALADVKKIRNKFIGVIEDES